MRLAAVGLLLALLAVPSLAQDEAARRDAAERYVNSPPQQEMIDQLLAPGFLVEQIRMASPEIDQAMLDDLAEIVADELAVLRPQIEEAMIDAAVETFTLEEIVALDAFYRTPEGAGVARKMQPLMHRTMQTLAPAMQAAQARIIERAVERIQEQN